MLRETGFDGWLTVETDGWDGDPSEAKSAAVPNTVCPVETDGWDGDPSEGARTSMGFLRREGMIG